MRVCFNLIYFIFVLIDSIKNGCVDGKSFLIEYRKIDIVFFDDEDRKVIDS